MPCCVAGRAMSVWTRPPQRRPKGAPVVHEPTPAHEAVPTHHQDPGYVRISTRPWSWVIAGDQKIDTVGHKLVLPPGKHELKIVCGACTKPYSIERTVTVRPDQ